MNDFLTRIQMKCGEVTIQNVTAMGRTEKSSLTGKERIVPCLLIFYWYNTEKIIATNNPGKA